MGTRGLGCGAWGRMHGRSFQQAELNPRPSSRVKREESWAAGRSRVGVSVGPSVPVSEGESTDLQEGCRQENTHRFC